MIKHLSDPTKRALRIRAAEHGRTLSEKAASLIDEGVSRKIAEPKENWVDAMRRKVMAFGGFEMEIPPRNSHQT